MATTTDISRLQLAPYAKECAIKICQAFPWAVFTSGRRSLEEQASVMAHNVMVARKQGKGNWIRRTYLHAGDLADWVDQHPNASLEDVDTYLHVALLAMNDNSLMNISRHLTGDAFDIHPVLDSSGLPTNEGSQLIDFVRRNLQGAKILTNEGGLVVWHIQVPCSVEV